ncbi:MAG: hypothetical protein H7843_12990 [Nitrospirota bacterium]
MKIKMKTYNITIPIKYNDGTKIEKAKIDQTFDDIRNEFGECSWTTVKGIWESDGVVYYDKSYRVSVTTYDTKENDRWFINFGKILENRLRQIKIYITQSKETPLT